MKFSLAAVSLLATLAVALPHARDVKQSKSIDWEDYEPEYGEEEEVIEGNKGNSTLPNPSQSTPSPAQPTPNPSQPASNPAQPPPLADANRFTESTLLMTTTANGTVDYQQLLHGECFVLLAAQTHQRSNQQP